MSQVPFEPGRAARRQLAFERLRGVSGVCAQVRPSAGVNPARMFNRRTVAARSSAARLHGGPDGLGHTPAVLGLHLHHADGRRLLDDPRPPATGAVPDAIGFQQGDAQAAAAQAYAVAAPVSPPPMMTMGTSSLSASAG